MRRRVVVIAALAALVGAASAGASTSKSFSIPLPAPKTGKIVELVVKGSQVAKGDPFTFRIGNLSSLPSYIRVASDVVPAKSDAFDIFIAINAPAGLVHGRRVAVVDALDLIVLSAGTAFPARGTHIEEGDGCSAFALVDGDTGTTYATLGPWQSTGKSIFAFTKTADPNCKKK